MGLFPATIARHLRPMTTALISFGWNSDYRLSEAALKLAFTLATRL
jgi:hypothetical protein